MQPTPPWVHSTLEFAMNIEFDEVVLQDVSDDALELAAGGAPGVTYLGRCAR